MQAPHGVTLAELAELTGGRVQGDASTRITNALPLDEAGPSDITFVDQADRLKKVATSSAAALVVPSGVDYADKPCLVVSDVQAAFTVIVAKFRRPVVTKRAGIHPTAVVSPTAKIAAGVHIGPHVVVGQRTTVGAGSVLHAHVVVGDGCQIGAGSTLFARVTLYDNVVLGQNVIVHAGAVLGAYGFGYRQAQGAHQLTAQLGHVEVGDNVEIGANVTIDRGTYSATRIGAGTKIDNLVQIAHNCQIGKHNLLCSQVGIAGSTSTGDWVVMAGQVGVRDHVHVGTGAKIGAMAGVSNDVPAGITVFGAPATPERDQKLQMAAIAKLPQMRKDFKALAKAVNMLLAERGMHGEALDPAA